MSKTKYSVCLPVQMVTKICILQENIKKAHCQRINWCPHLILFLNINTVKCVWPSSGLHKVPALGPHIAMNDGPLVAKMWCAGGGPCGPAPHTEP